MLLHEVVVNGFSGVEVGRDVVGLGQLGTVGFGKKVGLGNAHVVAQASACKVGFGVLHGGLRWVLRVGLQSLTRGCFFV